MLEIVSEFTVKMIAQRCISLIMTALVLACPYCDCGECCGMFLPDACVDSDGCDEGVEAVCGCDCDGDAQFPCDHDRSDRSQNVDCFCNGAVLSDGTHCPDHDTDGGLFAMAVMDTSITRQFAGTQTTDPSLLRGVHFPPLLSGRDICTLIGSYLL